MVWETKPQHMYRLTCHCAIRAQTLGLQENLVVSDLTTGPLSDPRIKDRTYVYGLRKSVCFDVEAKAPKGNPQSLQQYLYCYVLYLYICVSQATMLSCGHYGSRHKIQCREQTSNCVSIATPRVHPLKCPGPYYGGPLGRGGG